MRQRLPIGTSTARQGWIWLTSAGVDFVALGAAVGLIAAIALGAPHLQLH